MSKSTPPFYLQVLVGGAWEPLTRDGIPIVCQTCPAARREFAKRLPIAYERARQGGEVTARIVDRWGHVQRLPRA
jgi:hypothetical protein